MWGTTLQNVNYISILFISTHVPRVGYNGIADALAKRLEISTHVPRVGYNSQLALISFKICKDFNSRTPCGVQQMEELFKNDLHNFNSRTPCGVQL